MSAHIHEYIRSLVIRRNVIAELIDPDASTPGACELSDRYRARVTEIDRIIDELRALAKRERRELWYMRKLVRYIVTSNPPKTRRRRLLTYRRYLDAAGELIGG